MQIARAFPAPHQEVQTRGGPTVESEHMVKVVAQACPASRTFSTA